MKKISYSVRFKNNIGIYVFHDSAVLLLPGSRSYLLQLGDYNTGKPNKEWVRAHDRLKKALKQHNE